MAFLGLCYLLFYLLSVRVQAPSRNPSTMTTSPQITQTENPSACPPGFAREFEQYCYWFVNSTYPYECPYKKSLQVLEPTFMAVASVAKLEKVWLLSKHDVFRYFEEETFGPYYKLLSNPLSPYPSSVHSSCLFYEFTQPFKMDLANCNSEGVTGVCLYKSEDVDFCEVYHSICNKTCEGKSVYKNDFLCGSNYIDDESCAECDRRFEEYPEPKITLRLLKNKEILIIVSNYKKTVSNRLPGADTYLSMYSFTDNSHPTKDTVYGHIYLSQTFQKLSEDIAISSITFSTTASVFWFEMFTYPNLTPIKSEELIISDGSGSFVVNITQDYDLDYYLPFDLHVDTTITLAALFGGYVTKCNLLEIYPPFDNRTKITLGFHILTHDTEEIALEDITNILKRSNYNYSVAANEYCLNITDDKLNLSWNKTKLGAVSPSNELVLDNQGLPISRECKGSFKHGAYWSQPKPGNTNEDYSQLTKALFELLKSNVSASELNDLLLALVQGDDDIIPYDVYLIAKCLEKIIFSENPYDVKTTVQIVDTIMKFDPVTMREAQVRLNATDSIIYSIDMMMQSLVNDNDNLIIVEGEQLLSQIVSLQDTNVTGMAIYKSGNSILLKPLIAVHNVEEVDTSHLILAAFLPSTLNVNAPDQTHLIISVYLDNVLFNSLETNSVSNTVVSAFIPNQTYVSLEKPLTVIFGESLPRKSNISCAYYNYGINNQLDSLYGNWLLDGDIIVNSKTQVCLFDHMTHFALIFEAPESKALNIVTAIMCAFSILGILSIFFTAIILSNWRKGEGIKVLLNYSGAILLQDVLLLMFDLTHTDNHVSCSFYAIFLQYSILAQFTWMLIISYIQYERLVRVFNTRTSSFRNLVVIGWTVPLFPIAVNLCVDITIYIQGNYCFVSDWTLYLSLFLPIGIVLTINMIIFLKIVISIFSKVGCKVSGDTLVKQKISVCIILFFLSGFAWTFGFLAKILQSMFLSYIFCVFSTGQGLVLWIYFILLNREVRELLRRSKFVCTINSIGKDFHLPRFHVKSSSENNELCVSNSSIGSNSNTSEDHFNRY